MLPRPVPSGVVCCIDHVCTPLGDLMIKNRSVRRIQAFSLKASEWLATRCSGIIKMDSGFASVYQKAVNCPWNTVDFNCLWWLFKMNLIFSLFHAITNIYIWGETYRIVRSAASHFMNPEVMALREAHVIDCEDILRRLTVNWSIIFPLILAPG